jgi:hypothetical protein
MADTLKDIFENVNNWLKFAEAKNATLVAGNGLIIFGTLRLINDMCIHEYILYYIYFSLFLISISLVMALVSFMPKLKIPDFLLNNKIETTDNLLFFGHIVKYQDKTYLDKINNIIKSQDSTDLDLMYAQQIIINSKIAMNKYNIFNNALHFTLAGIVSPVVYLIIKELFIEKEIRKVG